MAKRRPSGDGMVRKRDDGRWEGRIVVGHKENGDPIFRYVYGKTQKEVQEKTEGSNQTLGEWLDRWLDEYAPATSRPSTLDGYKTYSEHYIKPTLGKKKISAISTADIQKFYGKLKTEGRVTEHPEYGHARSDATVRRVHSMLRLALAEAKRRHMIAVNPVEGAVAPRSAAQPRKILNDAELDRFMETIQVDPAWHAFFYTELTTGLRRGEICGLRWDDFDEAEGTLRVRRTLRTEKDGRLVAGATKTDTGNRKIVLPESTAELLRERRRGSLSEWIFPNLTEPEKPISPNAAYRRLKVLLKRAGLPDIQFHRLRHTFSSHALASGVDPKTLSGILGHTNASFTLDTYAHVTGEMQKRAAVIVGDFIDDIMEVQ